MSITDELARNSSPPAEAVIRKEMVAGIAYFLDQEFTDPAKAAVANVSPGSITNGVTPITTAGVTPANARTDIQALINAMTTAGISTAGAVLLMSETNAAALSSALNALGQNLFNDLTVNGGSALGIKVIASQTVGNNVILLQPAAVLYADDGGVTIDVSTEASVQMDDAPAAGRRDDRVYLVLAKQSRRPARGTPCQLEARADGRRATTPWPPTRFDRRHHDGPDRARHSAGLFSRRRASARLSHDRRRRAPRGPGDHHQRSGHVRYPSSRAAGST